MAGIDRQLLLLEAVAHFLHPVRDAVGIGDDDGRAVVGFGFLEGLDGLRGVGAEGDARHIDVVVVHGHQGQVLLFRGLAAGGELGDRAERGGLGGLSAGVGIHLGIEDQDVDVGAGGEDVVEPAVADVIGPAVAADDPDGFPDEEIGDGEEIQGFGLAVAGQFPLELGDAFALGGDAAFVLLVGVQQPLGQVVADVGLEGLDELGGVAGLLVAGQAEAVAELRGILEQAVGPGGSAAVAVLGPRGGGQVAAVDGRAAGGVGDDGPVAEELAHQAEIGRFAAAGAGAGELEERHGVLGVLDHAEVELGAVHHGQGLEERDVPALLLDDREFGPEVDGLAGGVVLVLFRAGGDADAAARAVLDIDLQGVGLVVLAADRRMLEAGRRLVQQGLVVLVGADDGMRAHERAGAALDAFLLVPDRNVERHIAFLPARGGGGERAVHRHLGDRQPVAVAHHDGGDDLLDEVRGLVRHRRGNLEGGGDLAVGDLEQIGESLVHGLEVLLDDFIALLAVGLLDGFLDLRNGVVLGQDAGNGEEAGLHDGIDARAHAGAFGDRIAVNVVELQFLLDDPGLDLLGQLVPDLVLGEGAVEEEDAAGGGVAEDVGLEEELVLVAGDEAGFLDQVGAVDRVGAEPQMRDGARTGLLGVINKVALRVEIRLFADDLDGVLVGAHGAVGAEAEEHGIGDAGMADEERGVQIQAGVGDVVGDAHGEPVFGLVLFELVEDRLDHGRGEFLRRQAVAPADDLGQGGEGAVGGRLREARQHVLVERLAVGAGFLGAVEHADGLGGRRQGREEVLQRERAVEAHHDGPDLFALLLQFLDRFQRGFGAGAHQHDDALGVGRADVVKGLVVTSRQLAELFHGRGDDVRAGLVELVDGLAPLEIDVGVLGGAPDEGLFGIERARPVVGDQLVADHGADDLVGDHFHLADLVGGAEAVEEMQEGHARLEGGGLGDQGRIHDFLDAVGGEHGPADLTAGHDILVVAENREGGGGDGPGGDMEDGRGQFPGDLVHVGDHQQEALRGGEGGGEGAGLQRAVHGAGGPAFGLQFGDGRHGAPEVGAAFGCPLVGPFAHVRGRRDGINRSDFVGLEGDVGGGFVAVNDRDFLVFAHMA